MGIVSYPFDAQTTTETQYSRFFRELRGTGVLGDPSGSALQVSSPSSGMSLRIAVGAAIIRGHYVEVDAIESMTLAVGVAQARVDLVVMRLNPAGNNIQPAIIAGTPGAGAPAATQTDTGIYDLPLAQVAVGPNVTAITSANITDRRVFSPGDVGVWTTANRPAIPRIPSFGYNVTNQGFEYWNGAQWLPLFTLTDSSDIDFTYSAGSNSWTAGVKTGSIGVEKLSDMPAGTIMARPGSTMSAGPPSHMSTTALAAQIAPNLPNGSITNDKLAAGAVSAQKIENILGPRLLGRLTPSSGPVSYLELSLVAEAIAPSVPPAADDTITNAKLSNMASQTIKGRISGGTGDPEDLSAASARAVLGLGSFATATTLSGAVTGTATSTAIATGAVTVNNLADNAVSTSKIADNAVANSKMADMVAGTIKGRAVGAGSGDPTDLTGVQAMAAIGAQPLVENVSVQTSATVPDVTTATMTRITLSGSNGTLVFPTAAAGKRFWLELKQDSTGSRTVTWPSTVRWPGGTAPTLSVAANRSDLFVFTCPPSGSLWIGSVAGQNYTVS